ncbi:MAG: nitroreductase [Bacteroidia bacterium]|jgi:nitroreductase
MNIETLGEELTLFEALRTTRAIRRLKPDPVPDELIRKICEAGTFAPSGGNRQPWLFIAVTEPERKRYIADCYRSIFDAYIAPAVEAALDPEFPDRKRRNIKAAMYLAEHMHEAPVLLVVAGWKRRGEPQLQSLFPAIQNILLACRAVGLGASLTTAHIGQGREIDSYLNLSPETPSCALIPIGWPIGKYGTPPRKSIDQCLFFERYDESASL